MIVGKRERQHQAGHEGAVTIDGLISGTRHAKDGHFRRIDDGCEGGAPDRSEARDRKASALHLRRSQLSVARAVGKLTQFTGDLVDVLVIGVANHRHDETVGGVGGEANVHVLLQDQVLATPIERGIDLWEFLQSLDARLEDERERRQLDALLGRLAFELNTCGFQLRDVSDIELRDVRNIDPARMQPRAGDALNPIERPCFDGAELREIDFRYFRQGSGAGSCGSASCQYLLDESLHVLVRDATLRARALDTSEIDTEFARELAYRRPGIRAREVSEDDRGRFRG